MTNRPKIRRIEAQFPPTRDNPAGYYGLWVQKDVNVYLAHKDPSRDQIFHSKEEVDVAVSNSIIDNLDEKGTEYVFFHFPNYSQSYKFTFQQLKEGSNIEYHKDDPQRGLRLADGEKVPEVKVGNYI